MIEGFDLQVSAGEIVRLSGRNGSGKSTLLKLISQNLVPTLGQIDLGGAEPAVYMDQNAGDMVAHPLTIREHFSAFAGRSGAGRYGSLPHEAELVSLGLGDVLDDFVGHRSGGQKQIISLLTILQSGAMILCLDEFSAALDAVARSVAGNLIQRYASDGVIFFVVSHSDLPGLIPREVSLD